MTAQVMIGEAAICPMLSPTLLILAATLAALPASAMVLTEGKPSRSFYWQKIEQKTGKAVYQCRATGDSKFQKAAACEKAGVVKPK